MLLPVDKDYKFLPLVLVFSDFLTVPLVFPWDDPALCRRIQWRTQPGDLSGTAGTVRMYDIGAPGHSSRLGVHHHSM